MRAVFVHGDQQRRLAERTARGASAGRDRPLTTPILDFESFHLAEAYHQKYSLRRLATVERELEAHYPALEDFVRSTAVTRINAFAGGTGTRAELDALAEDLGLSPGALAELRGAVY